MDPVQAAEEQITQLVSATDGAVQAATSAYVRHVFAHDFGREAPDTQGIRDKSLFAAKGLELVGVDILNRHSRNPELARRAWQSLIWPAFRLRRTALLSPAADIRDLVEEVVDGILANRQPEIRLELQQVALENPWTTPGVIDWGDHVLSEILRAFLLLARKHGGFSDVERALGVIRDLRAHQGEFEAAYLSLSGDGGRVASPDRAQIRASEPPLDENDLEVAARASILAAEYNIAKAIEITGTFLGGQYEGRGGAQMTAAGVKTELDRFFFTAREVLSGRNSDLRPLSGRLAVACKSMVDASVFAAVLPRRVRDALSSLARRSDRPILELWYAQREALQRSLLDPTRNAVVVSMPTSAGKTLLAELAMLQAYNDDPRSRIVYLAPTRALVTQVSLTLRRDVGERLSIRVATPSFELSPVESELLEDDFNILVTTPEKLDLLVRTDHPSVRELSLIVVDEAHNLNDPERGARLELLLAVLRRERIGARFLLLTPFATNARQLSQWLGGDQSSPIIVDWKPNDRVVGLVRPGAKLRRADSREMLFVSLPTIHSDCPAGESIPLGLAPAETNESKENVSLQAVLKWACARPGGVLLLASSRAAAAERASYLAAQMQIREVPQSVDIVCRYLDTEAGGEHPLSPLLKRGVAFHHAGLSPEARYFVERLVEEGAVKILCATTTLAQGVHFPLSVAIIESHTRSVVDRHGRWRKEALPPWELWNIIGRVGRTLEDPLGVVAFACTKEDQANRIREYLRNDSSEVSSTLWSLLRRLSGAQDVHFGTNLVDGIQAASAFLQYLVHAIAVSGREAVDGDLEGLLRASFVYEQAASENQELADELVRIARLYVTQLAHQKGNGLAGYAKMADGTGFSSPSVDVIFRNWRIQPAQQFSDADWEAGSMFPDDGSASIVLTNMIGTLKDLPEVRLGTETEGEFNPERIARIATAWVNGASLAQIAEAEYHGDLLKCTQHIYGTISNVVPWGVRAIQRVALAGRDDISWGNLDLVPAMVYHGVHSREAVALRMLGVPRIAAEGLASRYRESADNADTRGLSAWIGAASSEQWAQALPGDAAISGAECRRLWEVLEGRRKWSQILADGEQ